MTELVDFASRVLVELLPSRDFRSWRRWATGRQALERIHARVPQPTSPAIAGVWPAPVVLERAA